MVQPLAVYVHWPFCLKKCPYCDFNSHVSASVNHEDWREAYTKEITYYARLLGNRQVTSVFFGGGTPSLMQPETIEHVLNDLARHWDISDTCEITLEANPTSIEAEKFMAFKRAGVNRVSVGVQSLRDDQLKFLGREHSAAEALNALSIAGSTFDRMSFDLIYARPGQGMKEWADELAEALQYAKGHMSLYQLTIEDGTQFKTLRDSGRLVELDYDIAGDMYTMTTEMMADANIPAYEISNYASLGQESRHNLTYWRYQDYVGIGPGAHGRLTLPNGEKIATHTHKAPEIWMQNAVNHGHGAKPFNTLPLSDQGEEHMMMGLRLREGIDLGQLENLSQDAFLNNKIIIHLIDTNFLKIENGRLSVPTQQWPLLDSILAKILSAGCFAP